MEKLFLLDAYALIYRAYYAFIKNPRINSKGLNTSAILGFVNTLEEVLSKEHPTHIGIAFDPPGPTFRHEAYEQYKAQREETPEAIRTAVPIIKDIIKAYRIQDKARNVGFDWEKKEDVWDKVREELGELQAELAREDKEKSTDEFGDFLFSVINAGRLYHINPDNALERTNRKFIRRFNYVEQHSIRQGRSLKDMTLGEMDVLWNEAKEMEKRGS